MEKVEYNLPHKFDPREYQLPLLEAMDSGYKRAAVIWNRKAGKDLTAWNFTIKETHQRKGAYYYFFPEFAQGRKTIWDGMDETGRRFLDYIPRGIINGEPNNTEMKIKFTNGSLVQIIGADRFEKSVGPNPIGCVYSEYSIQDKKGWLYAMPILANNNGWAIFLYTPRGMGQGYEMYNMAKNNSKWFCELLTVNETKSVSEEKIDELRKSGMPEDLIQQEFFCSFTSGVVGAYYTKEISEAREQKRICKVAIESGLSVYTFWDLGIRGCTSIWLAQFIGREIHLVGNYTNSGVDLTHYVNWLKDWRDKHHITFGEHILPHDAKKRSMQTGKTTIDFLKELGLTCNTVKKPARKEDGIEAVRWIFNRCWFDEINCEEGIKYLSLYRREYDEVRGIYSVLAVPDVNSHGADAFQTLALWQQLKPVELEKKPTILEGRFRGGSGKQSWMSK